MRKKFLQLVMNIQFRLMLVTPSDLMQHYIFSGMTFSWEKFLILENNFQSYFLLLLFFYTNSRGLRHRNLAAIKLAAQSGISQIQGKQGPVDQIQDKSRAFPLVINGFRTNPKDAEGHLLFFDVEALVIQVHIYLHM